MRFLRARTTTFAGPDIGIGAVAQVAAAVVEWLSGGTAVCVAFWKTGKTFGAVERTVLSVDTVVGPHVRRDVALHSPLQPTDDSTHNRNARKRGSCNNIRHERPTSAAH